MAEASYSDSYHRSWALVIGIDRFVAAPALRTARLGAEAIANLLENQYSFDEVTALYDEDATLQNIQDAYSDLRYGMEPDDRFVVYVAGHGVGLEGTVRSEGWLVAHDSEPQRQRRMLRMRDLVDPNYTRAKHSLIILDACHSGYAVTFDQPRAVPTASPDPRKAAKHYLTRRAMQVFSSANPLETATDAALVDGHTPFTGYLLKALSGSEPAALSSVTNLLTSESVGEYVRNSVAAFPGAWQGPQLGVLPGDQGGLMVWRLPSSLDMLPALLQKDLRDEHPRVRYYAVEKAAALLNDDQLDAAVREVLEDIVTQDPSPEVRRRALAILTQSPAFVPDAPPAELNPAPAAIESDTPSQPPDQAVSREKPAGSKPKASEDEAALAFFHRWWRVGLWLAGVVYVATRMIGNSFVPALEVMALSAIPGILALSYLVRRRWSRGALLLLTTLAWIGTGSYVDVALWAIVVLTPIMIIWSLVDAVRNNV